MSNDRREQNLHKRFGLEITFKETFFGQSLVWTNWFKTEKQRDDAFDERLKNKFTDDKFLAKVQK